MAPHFSIKTFPCLPIGCRQLRRSFGDWYVFTYSGRDRPLCLSFRHPGQPRGVAPTTQVRVKTSRASGPGDFIFNKFIEEESAVRRSVLCVALSAGLFVCFSGVAWSVNPTGYGQAGGEYDIRIPRVPAGHLAKAKKVKPPFEATPEVLAEGESHFPGCRRVRQLPWSRRQGRRRRGQEPADPTPQLYESEIS